MLALKKIKNAEKIFNSIFEFISFHKSFLYSVLKMKSNEYGHKNH